MLFVPRVQVCLEIGTWIIRIGAGERDSMVGKGIGLEIRIVLLWKCLLCDKN